MEGERVVFSYQRGSSQGIRLLVNGEVDKNLLEALKLYIKLEEECESKPKTDDVRE